MITSGLCSGFRRAECQEGRGGPGAGARRRWLVDSGEKWADRTCAGKLPGESVRTYRLREHLIKQKNMFLGLNTASFTWPYTNKASRSELYAISNSFPKRRLCLNYCIYYHKIMQISHRGINKVLLLPLLLLCSSSISICLYWLFLYVIKYLFHWNESTTLWQKHV